ncbi:MAG: glycosyltransferase [Candidatus Omnitrophica bacterium]|nr:glycosyltransferase [Candidatus Omnitrophota bacterium]MBD3268746.1 glycosyltransferase [Candidatus Omnitrophota bacterium]
MNKSLVICPVYNEASTLAAFYNAIRSFYKGDILFIDDGSKDGSFPIIQGIEDKRKKFIRLSSRKGYGSVLLMGFRFALRGEYEKVVTIDTDLQHNPLHLPVFMEKLEYYRVVSGSRYLRANPKDIAENVPPERLIINRQVSKLISILFGFQSSDPFCGFRGYRRSFLEKVDLKEKSYGFALEVLLEIIRLDVSFFEIPVEVIYKDKNRQFLDGLEDPEKRFFYYLDIILKKYEVLRSKKEESFNCQPSS